ncbi:hypothetical protein I302_103940 [Kwoniella bestiolae CBS 10118]|uniref:Uncharacterized protein n=1 Tax=Kwoniella bestiolae CBS 10118 TaxID=1296100 RepID=A0A1B9G9W1_9TREE|nr:hypothetical protein I302_02646 [Kwoniella bestiolae CBS 10118]OCF27797.1 hypothetical protein I302_02646 [Kwoniella bestiolae CBS 10118]
MSLFSFASSTNEVGLAKIALRRLNKDSIYSGIPDNLSGYRAFISNLQPAFQAEILSLIMVNTKSDTCADHQGKPTNSIDWKWVAEKFNPDGRSEFSDEEYVSTDEEFRQEEPQECSGWEARGSYDWTADPAQDASGGW